MSSLSLGQIAERLGCELVGNPDIRITGVATLDNAQPSEISFLTNAKYTPKAKTTRAAAILTSEPIADATAAILLSANPYHDFARALSFFYQPPLPSPGIHAAASIHPTAAIGPNAAIGPFAVIGQDVVIGANAVIHPHVVIYQGVRIGHDFTAHSHAAIREFTIIGNRVTLQNGVVLGGDGFGFAKRADGRYDKIVQSGVTVIEDDVEVQSLTSIDRATLGETRVKRGAKIDSLVQIGHACTVGEDNILCGQTGLAGSTVLEKNVMMAGQAGSSGHLTIHKNAIVWAQAGLVGDVAENTVVAGSPAFHNRDWLRFSAALPKLPDLVKTVRLLERRLAALEGQECDNTSATEGSLEK